MIELQEKIKEPIFVIGFPKSGNTWLARILAELTQSNMASNSSLDIVNRADNSPEKKNGNYIIHKDHIVNDTKIASHAKVVYIVRDVRDVLVSAFFFNNGFVKEDWVRLDEKYTGFRGVMWRTYFRHQIKRMNKYWCGNEMSVLMNLIHGEKNIVGNWSKHVLSWLGDPNVTVVKYEDLLRNTEGEIIKVLDAFRIAVNNDVLREAISNQSFKKKKSEFLNSGDSLNAKFLRSGKAGGWKRFLSPSIIKKIEKKHESTMNKLGYKLEYHKGGL